MYNLHYTSLQPEHYKTHTIMGGVTFLEQGNYMQGYKYVFLYKTKKKVVLPLWLTLIKYQNKKNTVKKVPNFVHIFLFIFLLRKMVKKHPKFC